MRGNGNGMGELQVLIAVKWLRHSSLLTVR